MVEQITDSIATKLYGKIADEDIDKVIRVVSIVLNDYEVTKKEEAITPFTGYLPECYKVYMVTKKLEGKSDKTLALYKNYIEHMFNTLKTPIREITRNMIKVYLYRVQEERHISNRSLDSRRSILNSFFTWAAAEEYIDKNPMATLRPIKYESVERKPLTDMELERVRLACMDLRESALVEFFYSTGCRVTEAERVNITDIDFTSGEVKLFGKGNKHRTSYLTAKAILTIQQYLDSRDDDNNALFVYERLPHGRLKKAGIERSIAKIGDRADVPRLHPHLIRHTTATNALKHGMDITQVQKLLGHTNTNTTMIYAKVDMDDVKRNHQRYIA